MKIMKRTLTTLTVKMAEHRPWVGLHKPTTDQMMNMNARATAHTGHSTPESNKALSNEHHKRSGNKFTAFNKRASTTHSAPRGIVLLD